MIDSQRVFLSKTSQLYAGFFRSSVFMHAQKVMRKEFKHHRGQTGGWGVEQLAALDDSKYQEENESRLILKWLITTATVSEELSESAASRNIQIMDGEAFVEWLYNNWQALSDGTLNQRVIVKSGVWSFSEN